MEISILQWNVLFQEQADKILEFIKQIDADIVCLQELTQDSLANPGRNIPDEIMQLGYSGYYVATVNKPELGFGIMGNGIFSKCPITDKRTVWVRHEMPGGTEPSNESRAYLECKLHINGKRLTVGTAHLSFTPGFTFMPEKEVESKIFMDASSPNRVGFVFTGDFNALPNSSLIIELDKRFRHAGPDYTEPTWTTKPFDYQGFKADTLNWRLDYVFATKDMEVLSSEIIETDVSDHLPILVKLQI